MRCLIKNRPRGQVCDAWGGPSVQDLVEAAPFLVRVFAVALDPACPVMSALRPAAARADVLREIRSFELRAVLNVFGAFEQISRLNESLVSLPERVLCFPQPGL